MDALFIDSDLSPSEADARIEASPAEAVLHGAPGVVQGEDHAGAILDALSDGAALAHSLPAQLHPDGMITAAPLSLASPAIMEMHASARLLAVTRCVAGYRREAYLAQPHRWSLGAGEAKIWPALAEGGARLAPKVTTLQIVGENAPPAGGWTETALFGGWLTHLLNALPGEAPANTDDALERFGFPGRAGDSWFDEEIALAERQKAELRGAFHAWRMSRTPA
jgi:hypothetical protein